MLGPKISADQAESWGMIWQVVEDEALMDTVLKLARDMATQPTRAFALQKQAFARSAVNSLDTQLELERSLMSEAGKTDDYHEGVAAFLEKRAPVFKGK
jgi:2-(1,2-epoxy-1,2-dihydrophenyl)acetyl-CoA isomerase